MTPAPTPQTGTLASPGLPQIQALRRHLVVGAPRVDVLT